MEKGGGIIGKPPWRPWVPGLYGVLFGPLAAGMVTFINLRRMGYPAKARNIFALSMLYSISILVIFTLISAGENKIYGSAFLSVIGVIFPLFQISEYNEWKEVHKFGGYPSNGWSALGWAVLGLMILLAIIAFYSAVFIFIIQ